MRRGTITRLLTALAVVATTSLLVTGSGPASGGASGGASGRASGGTGCPSRSHLDARTMPTGTDVVGCGLVGAWYDAGGVLLQVPAPGHAVRGHGLLVAGAGGGDHDGGLTVAPSGRLEAQQGDGPGARARASARSSMATSSVIAPCRDSSYVLWDEKWFNQVPWHVNFAHRPAGISNAHTLAALKRAMANITGEQDSCGYADHVSLSASYKGSTTGANSVGQVKNDKGTYVVRCADGDSTSVSGFGNLPSSFLAYTCDWVVHQDGPDRTLSADVRFNTTDHAYTLHGASPGCRRKYDLESIATHEYGHLAGLGHVTGARHHDLTMYPSLYSCDTRDRSLARGDVLGLRAKY